MGEKFAGIHTHGVVWHFYTDALFEGDSTPIYSTCEWFHEDGNDVNHMLWHSHSSNLNPGKCGRFWSVWKNAGHGVPWCTEAVRMPHGGLISYFQTFGCF